MKGVAPGVMTKFEAESWKESRDSPPMETMLFRLGGARVKAVARLDPGVATLGLWTLVDLDPMASKPAVDDLDPDAAA